MPRIVLDTIGANYAHVSAIPCLKFGYVNGPRSAWTAAQIDEQRDRGELLAVIDVLGDAPHQAAIIDWENRDVQDPNKLRWWIEQRNAFRGDAVAYCNKDGLPGVLGAMHGTSEYFQLIVADLTESGEPPLFPPDYGLPPNVRLLGNQYVFPPRSGGPYDLNILFNDAWHATAAPVHLVGAAAPAPDVEQLLAAADVEPVAADVPKSDGPTSSAPPSSSSPAAGLQYLDTLAPPHVDMALPTQASAVVIAPDVVSTPDAEPARARPFVPAAATPIDHAAVYRWIQEGQAIAGLFRDANAGHVAGVLEEALGGMLEVGKLLSALGR